MSFFLHDFSHRQVTELFAHAHQLVDQAFKLAHGLNLLAVECNQRRIGEPDRYGLTGFFAGQQRIGATSKAGTIGVFDGQELLDKGAATQLAQIGQLAQQALTLVFEVRVTGRSGFHIVVHILQYKGQKQ